MPAAIGCLNDFKHFIKNAVLTKNLYSVFICLFTFHNFNAYCTNDFHVPSQSGSALQNHFCL
jgi:hypothetical protein